MPIGPGPFSRDGRFAGPEPSEAPYRRVERCKQCGKEAELDEGLCAECKWEAEVGLIPPMQQKKRSFWSFLKRRS